MGNTHIEPHTKKRMCKYMKENNILTPTKAVEHFLANTDLLRVIEMLVDVLKAENERLKNLRGDES